MDMKSATRLNLSNYLELTKPRVTFLVVITTLVGYYLGARGEVDALRLLCTLIGTALVAGGTSALNQYLERDIDAKMTRTRNRPLPTGRLTPRQALIFAYSITLIGVLTLALAVNLLTAALAAATHIFYIFLYTPLKQKTSLSTLVGAIPGALPPVGGWTAARNELGIEALVLFAILFLWQLPHVLAISWLYSEDYKRGGFPLLPIIDPQGKSTSRQIITNCLALLPVSLLPTIIGLAGPVYFIGALILGLTFLGFGILVAIEKNNLSARRMMLASLAYLPALLGLLTFDKTSF
jgi:protoheme IX farnesyltransferase